MKRRDVMSSAVRILKSPQQWASPRMIRYAPQEEDSYALPTRTRCGAARRLERLEQPRLRSRDRRLESESHHDHAAERHQVDEDGGVRTRDAVRRPLEAGILRGAREVVAPQ